MKLKLVHCYVYYDDGKREWEGSTRNWSSTALWYSGPSVIRTPVIRSPVIRTSVIRIPGGLVRTVFSQLQPSISYWNYYYGTLLLLFRPSTPALGPTQAPVNAHRVFPGGKVRPGRAANHSLPSKRRGLGRVELYLYPLWATTGPVTGLLYLYTLLLHTVRYSISVFRRFYFSGDFLVLPTSWIFLLVVQTPG